MRRGAALICVQTVALGLCLVLVSLLFTGLTQGERMALEAMRHLGKEYVLGQRGPEKFDCSGLVMYCLKPEGFEFPYHAAEVIGTDERYPLIKNPRDLLPGDVVCFDTVRDRDPSDHMGFWMGGNRFVHASSTGEVKISALEDFYLEKFTGARRYVQAYTYLPTGKQIGECLDSTAIPVKLRPVRNWFDGLNIPKKAEALKGKITELWNSFFRKP
jgi:hypothetical protein